MKGVNSQNVSLVSGHRTILKLKLNRQSTIQLLDKTGTVQIILL